MKINVNSEIGKLKKVMLHRPGKEVERQYPEIFEHTLFDDIMYVKKAQEEHDEFARKLKENGVEVLYVEEQVSQIFDHDPSLRKQFLEQFIKEAKIDNEIVFKAIYEFLDSEDNNLEFVRNVIAGVLKSEVQPKWDTSVESMTLQNESYPFFIEPIPNLLFQRDPIASVHSGMSIHNMAKPIRKREGIFYEYLFKYHPNWKDTNQLLKRDHHGSMEGGDVLVMSKKTIFVGCSERTTSKAVEQLAKVLFENNKELKEVIGIQIPESHATMHLDTIFTQLDVDKFSVDLDMAKNKYFIYEMTKENDKIKVGVSEKTIKELLAQYVHPNPKLVVIADGEQVAGKAEQWNDGANSLALEPGTIFVYDRNIYTNAALKREGVKIIEVPSSELSRGRGGPRCMAMPLEREEI